MAKKIDLLVGAKEDIEQLRQIKKAVLAFYKYDLEKKDHLKQRERVSEIGTLVSFLVLKNDIVPTLSRIPATRKIYVIIALRAGLPFFDQTVAKKFLILLEQHGYGNLQIQLVPIGVQRKTETMSLKMYFPGIKSNLRKILGEKKRGLFLVFDFGSSTGCTMSGIGQKLLSVGVPKNRILLRSGIVSQRAARCVGQRGFHLRGGILGQTGLELGLNDYRRDWTIAIDGQSVPLFDWGESLIGMSQDDTPEKAKRDLKILMNELNAVYLLVNKEPLSSQDYTYLSNYYWQAYLDQQEIH